MAKDMVPYRDSYAPFWLSLYMDRCTGWISSHRPCR